MHVWLCPFGSITRLPLPNSSATYSKQRPCSFPLGRERRLFLRVFTANSSDLHRQLRTSQEQNEFCAAFISSMVGSGDVSFLGNFSCTHFDCISELTAKRGQMKIQLKTLATLALVSALSAGLAQTTSSGTTSTTPKRTTTRKAVAKKPSVESQIQSLRDDLQNQQSQIQGLKQQLSDRDQQLQQAQQAAAAAQAAATQAQQQAAQQSTTLTENTAAVGNLQGAVNDLKTNNLSLASTVQEQQTKVDR